MCLRSRGHTYVKIHYIIKRKQCVQVSTPAIGNEKSFKSYSEIRMRTVALLTHLKILFVEVCEKVCENMKGEFIDSDLSILGTKIILFSH